ncbi:MAG: hypothetical protein ABWY12_09810 [Burkholderiales bacterium]
MKTAPAQTLSPEPPDFSLVLGGPLYQLMRRTHLSGDVLEMVSRRVIVLALIAWLPLLVLSIAEGHAWGGSVKLPFLMDVDVHARFLLALPLFIVAELVVHQRMRVVVGAFVKRGLVPDEARATFDTAVASAMRLRNSIVVESLMIAVVYGVGVLLVWRTRAAIDVPTWYGMAAAGKLQPTLAGWWFGCVSLPIIQFILLRWYFRLFIWTRFLWQVSRIELRLVPTHPDRAGGLGFLSTVTHAFAPLLAGQGVLLASVMANKIFYAGAKLTDFKLELLAMVIMMLFFVLAPLLVFTPRLARTKRKGLLEYGGLAQRYVREFDEKWLRGGAPADEPLVGSGDIQSLADLGNSFEVVKGMKPVPFGKDTVLQLAVISLAPVAPLVLTMIPLGELIDQFLKIVF